MLNGVCFWRVSVRHRLCQGSSVSLRRHSPFLSVQRYPRGQAQWKGGRLVSPTYDVHTSTVKPGSWAYLGLGSRFFVSSQEGCLGFPDCLVPPFQRGLCVSCNSHGQKFGSELLAAVTTVITRDNDCTTCVDVFCLVGFLQSEG